MKLVISAVTPLHIDEMRVALNIVLGDPLWHGDRIAKDGAQLISLCGGNLLDLDEEDRKVRFIHHSVIQHLLLPAASPSTTAYHFTLEDAQNFTGSTCVTYLNLPTFDDRMTIARNLKSDDLLDNIVQSNQQNSSVVSRVVQHIQFRDNKRGRTSQIDIGRIVTEIQAARIKDDLDPRSFLRYATSNWLSHTALFDEEIQECKKTWKLWWRLLYGGVAIVTPPCPNIAGEPLPALVWAVKKAHGSLFRNIICETSLHLSQIEEVIHPLEVHRSIHGWWLGDLLAQYLNNVQATGRPPSGSTANNITLLLDLGADPATPHHISGSVPLKMLIPIITSTGFGPGGFVPANTRRDFVRRIFAYPAVQKSLDDPDVLSILEIHLRNDEFDMLAVISAVRPDLRFPRYRGGPGEHTPVSAIEELEAPKIKGPKIERWEDVEGLARKGQLSTAAISPLLEAMCTEDNAWIYELPCLGAGPGAAPPTMAYRISPGSRPNLDHDCHLPSESAPRPVEKALRTKRWEDIESLARKGQLNEPTSSGSSLLLEAIGTRDDAWVYHLLCLGADPNFEPPPTRPTGYRIHTPDVNLSCNPLQSALRQRRTRVCLELLRHGANVDQIGLSHMQIARETGNAIMVARLQECTDGQQHHKQGHTPRTALATACKMLFSHEYSSLNLPLGHPEGFARSYRFDLDWRWALDKIIYSLALDADAEYVNAQDEEGETALHHVSKARGQTALRLNTLVHVLLSQGADTNLVNRRGETPLFLAIRNRFAPINSLVRPLLDAGADPNAACPWPLQECSLLHLAMGELVRPAQFNMELVHLLLQAGADPRDPVDLVSPDPSFLALARERDMKELVGALEEYTRKLNGRQEST